MPFIAPELIIEAKRMDLLTYLRNYEPYELVKFSGNTYTTRTHDSLKIPMASGCGGRKVRGQKCPRLPYQSKRSELP